MSFLPAEPYTPPQIVTKSKRLSRSVSLSGEGLGLPAPLSRSQSLTPQSGSGEGAGHPAPPSHSQSLIPHSQSSTLPEMLHSIDEVGAASDLEVSREQDESLESSEKSEQGSGFYLPNEQSSGSSDAEKEKNSGKLGLKGGVNMPHVATPLLPPLDQPVPDDWVSVKGEFVSVTAITISHLAKDTIAVPDAKLDDGTIYLVIVHGSVTRLKMLQFFLAMQDGSQKPSEDAEIIKVKAYRFEPEASEGLMTVDGEVTDFGPIQGQVMPSMAKIMSLVK